MKKIIQITLLLCCFALTGCIETLEEVWLNKDGSGEYHLTFDMSEMFSNPMMKSMMEEAASEEGLEGMGLDLGNMDTMAVLGDGSGGILDKVVMHMVTSDSTGDFFIKMTLPFEEVSEIDEFYKALAEQGGQNAAAGPMGALGGSFLTPGGTFELKRRKLTRNPTPEGDGEDMFDGEEGEFMKMFFASGTYKTVYHLPGKVKKTTIEGAAVDGKTITIEHSLLDLIEGNAKLNGEIKYKRK